MKTLIVITWEPTGVHEIRITCARIHAVPRMEDTHCTLFAQDDEGHTIAVIDNVVKAFFDGVVTSQSVGPQQGK